MFGYSLDWKFFAVAAAIFASLTAILGKIGVAGVPSNFATLVRTVVILIFLLVLTAWGREFAAAKMVTTKTWIFLILSGLSTGVSWICYFRALQLGPVSKVAPIDKMSLGLTIFFALVFLGEAFSWKVVIGGGLVILGSLILVL